VDRPALEHHYSAAVSSEVEIRAMYVDLLERALMHTLYRPIDTTPPPEHVVEDLRLIVAAAVAAGESFTIDPVQVRLEGRDVPAYGQTMVGLKRLENVRHCVERILLDDVPGDLLEAGVWRGGVAIFMRGLLRAHGIDDRQVVVADSFEGLPAADAERYPADATIAEEDAGRLAVSVDEVRRNFANYDLLDDQVEFVKGWFRDTMPGLSDRRWALLRLDGDLYESTMDCLDNLYEQLSPGGFVIIDDYLLEPCAQAVHDYRDAHGIVEPIEDIDFVSAYWRRSF
jgi:hypothetical protein